MYQAALATTVSEVPIAYLLAQGPPLQVKLAPIPLGLDERLKGCSAARADLASAGAGVASTTIAATSEAAKFLLRSCLPRSLPGRTLVDASPDGPPAPSHLSRAGNPRKSD